MKYLPIFKSVLLSILMLLALQVWGQADEMRKDKLQVGISALNTSQFREAYEILGELAKSDSAEGQYYFGQLFETVTYYFLNDLDFNEKYGWTCTKDKEPISAFYNDACLQDAAFWYEKAAEGGNVAAQEKIAELYSIGIGVIRDRKKGHYWYKEAAEQGDVKSILAVGIAYVKGDLEKKDERKGKVFIENAVARGIKEGRYWLGFIYENGIGTAVDLKKAYEFYLVNAKELKSPRAAIAIGILYEHGSGLEKNLFEATKWHMIAHEFGVPSAFTGMPRLVDKLSRKDWGRARESARRWIGENK